MFQVTSTPMLLPPSVLILRALPPTASCSLPGQVPLMPGSGEVVGTTIEEQADRACKNIRAILEANGLTFEDVVKTTCFLADMGDFGAFNAVYEKYFVSKPARSCVAVRELPKKVLCEVEIIAAFPEK